MKTASVALAALAALSLAACASRPKPMGPVATGGPPPPPPPSSSYRGPEAAPPVGPVTQSGAPMPGSQQDLVLNAGDLVFFDFDRYQVRGDARETLDKQSAWLSRYPNVRVRVEGNCDERGTREYNFALGARRAEAVKEYLVERGVPASRIDTISYGKEKPLFPTGGDEGDAKNRNAHTVVE